MGLYKCLQRSMSSWLRRCVLKQKLMLVFAVTALGIPHLANLYQFGTNSNWAESVIMFVNPSA